MNRVLCAALIMTTMITAIAQQEKKYQSLLWEVSGNGLEKKSYMYGTMHVSERISYHLSDDFFEHLLAADIVATEIDFKLWAEEDELLNPAAGFDMWDFSFYWGGSGFYRQFQRKPIEKQDVMRHFFNRNWSMNNILFRTSDFRADYQEETYLDMFIYQTGRKYQKKTTGLEDIREMYSMTSALNEIDDYPSDENVRKVRRMLKGKDYFEAISDYYREKDLDMIDSLQALILPESYREVMLFRRNEIMVQNMIPLMQEGSLFAAVGAAHIPGKQGIVEILRGLGYTVTPVFGEYSEAGRQTKKQIDEFFITPEFTEFSTSDGMITMPVFDLIIWQGKTIYSPDIANGGYISIMRTPLHNFLHKDGKDFNHLTLDSLFFENIPGEINSKEFVQQKHFCYYDIKNTTKAGHTQRHRFYVTPLELITISMCGAGNYSHQFNENVFSEIRIMEPEKNRVSFSPQKGNFTAELPGYFCVYGDRKNPVVPENAEVYGFDFSNNSGYFIIEDRLPDFQFEETAFELERIHKEYYRQYDQNILTVIETTPFSFTSKSKIGNNDFALKTVAYGGSYFLLGCVKCNTTQQQQFFNSFRISEPASDEEYRTYTDENFLFSIDLPFRQNEMLFITNQKKKPQKPKKDENIFTSASQSYVFNAVGGTTVDLRVYQYHPYESLKSADSLFAEIRSDYLKEKEEKGENEDDWQLDEYYDFEFDYEVLVELEELFEMESSYDETTTFYTQKKAGPVASMWDHVLGLKKEKKLMLLNEKITHHEEKKYYTYDYTLSVESSHYAIKTREVVTDGMRFTLKTIVPAEYAGENAFIERLFNSFEPVDTLFEHSVFDDKLKLFLQHMSGEHDSIRTSALKSLRYLDINQSHAGELQHLFETVEIKNSNVEYLALLLQKIGAVEDDKVLEFLDQEYRKERQNTKLKIAILKGLAAQENEKAFEKILELMDENLPISENKSDISGLFIAFGKNLEYSRNLLPDIFEYFLIEEYKDPMLTFCRKLAESEYFDPQLLESVKRMLLSSANIEYRRTLSWVNNRISSKESIFGNPAVNAAKQLHTYLYLIHPFTSEKDYADWWAKVKKLGINETMILMLNIELDKGEVNPDLISELLEKPETQFAAYVLISNKSHGTKLPALSQDELARSAVILMDQVDLEKRDFVFLFDKTQQFHNQKVRFYFYRMENKERTDEGNDDATLLSIGFVLDGKGRIVPGAFYSGLQQVILDETKINDYCLEIIDRSLNGFRLRASHGKNEQESFYYGY
jgi:uncharacterized protein YbaP (TraB family)